MGVRMKEHDGSIRAPSAMAPSAGVAVGGRGRHVRFAVWVTLLVLVVCLLGAIASPAKTATRHPSAVAGRNTVSHHGGCQFEPGRYGRGT